MTAVPQAQPAPEPGIRKRVKAARPGEILDAAFEEFVDKGYAGARLEDVARRIGVTKGTIYLYFPSKIELFKAVVRACTQPVMTEAEQQIATFKGPISDLLRGLLLTAYSNIVEKRREREIMRLLIAEGSKHPELTEFYYGEVLSGCIRLLERLMALGIETGEIRPSAVTEMPLVLFSPVVHAATWDLLFGERRPLDIERFKAAHLELVLSSLLVR